MALQLLIDFLYYLPKDKGTTILMKDFTFNELLEVM
jgi:hypothetical protein